MKNLVLKITIMFIVMFLGVNITHAASFSVSVGSKNLSKGNTTKLTIKGSDVTGRFNIKSSNSSVVSISEDRAWIENDSYTITLSALNVGTSTITITPSGVSDSNGNPANLSAKSITITVSLPREKSTDNNLKGLSVEGHVISPEFNKDTLDYKVEVPEGTKSINVVGTPNSRYAKVTGTGSIEVTEGVNNLSIVVKSESGSEKVYNLVVNVVDQNPIEVVVDNINYTVIKLRDNYTCPESFTDSELIIDNVSIPSCTNEKINYNLVGLKNVDGTVDSFIYDNGNYTKYMELNSTLLKIIPEKYDGVIDGLIEGTLKINEEEYQAFKFSNESRFNVIYGTNIITGEKDFYLYDTLNNTFNVYDTEYIDHLKNQNQTYLYVIIAFGCGLFLAIICIILISKRKKKYKNKDNKKIDNKEKNKDDINKIKDNDKTHYDLFESDRKKKTKKK